VRLTKEQENVFDLAIAGKKCVEAHQGNSSGMQKGLDLGIKR
jgi:hypothetical protein